jgi:DNA-binding transcriptional LysR family regulator
MTLTQLTYFLTALRAGSFSAAAQQLYVAQPTLSDQIARLERELGTSLFIRGNRGLTLTDAGRRLQPEAEAVVSATERARASVEDVKALTTGTVTFGAFSSAHYYLLSNLVIQFRRLYPGVKVRAFAHNSTDVARAVRDGEFESGLVALPIDDRGLELSQTVWECEAGYFSTDSALLQRKADVDTLLAAPLVLPEAYSGNADPTRRQLNERAQLIGRSIDPDIEVESPAAALEIAASGVASTVAPIPLAKVLGYARRLKFVTFAEPLVERFAFVTRDSAHVSPATRAMIKMAAEQLRHLDLKPKH